LHLFFLKKNSAKTWNANTFFRWNIKSDTLFTFFWKKRAKNFIPFHSKRQNLARKIQPKHETQRRFSDETQNLIHYSLFSKKSAQDFSFHFIPNAKNLREKFSQNMKRKYVFQMKSKIWYINWLFQKKARKIFHSILFQTPKPCAKNSAKTWNANTFFRWKVKSDTLIDYSKKKRARFFIPFHSKR